MPTSLLRGLTARTFAIGLLATALLSGCASDPTTSNVDPTADLSSYNTYAFLADLATDKGADYGSLETTYLKRRLLSLTKVLLLGASGVLSKISEKLSVT